jgi:hypothetical protein
MFSFDEIPIVKFKIEHDVGIFSVAGIFVVVFES